jgi:hypothetical protein
MQKAIQKWECRVVCLAALAVGAQVGQAQVFAEGFAQKTSSSCSGGGGGITLPKGFCATIFADNIGHARQIGVAPDGTVFVNTWSGPYYGNDKPPAGGFLVALKDTKGAGEADVNIRFGRFSKKAATAVQGSPSISIGSMLRLMTGFFAMT